MATTSKEHLKRARILLLVRCLSLSKSEWKNITKTNYKKSRKQNPWREVFILASFTCWTKPVLKRPIPSAPSQQPQNYCSEEMGTDSSRPHDNKPSTEPDTSTRTMKGNTCYAGTRTIKQWVKKLFKKGFNYTKTNDENTCCTGTCTINDVKNKMF